MHSLKSSSFKKKTKPCPLGFEKVIVLKTKVNRETEEYS